MIRYDVTVKIKGDKATTIGANGRIDDHKSLSNLQYIPTVHLYNSPPSSLILTGRVEIYLGIMLP
jgi:hypothetical protein